MLKEVKQIKLGLRAYGRILKRVLERDDWRCQKCGSLENLQIHHKVKRSQQGNDSIENLIALCAPCHASQHGPLYLDGNALEASPPIIATVANRRQ